LPVGLPPCCRRPDRPDIAHPTVTSTTEFGAARQTMAMFTAKDLATTGRIDEVEVHEREPAALPCQ